MNDPKPTLPITTALVNLVPKAIIRFWKYVKRGADDECWVWSGRVNPDGYGKLYNAGQEVGAHRASWIIHNGAIPHGKQVLHRCDNPPCCNPNHLWLGTPRNNHKDKIAKGRANQYRKLTPIQVMEIRKRHSLGEMLIAIAKDYNITAPAVGAIVHRHVWRYL